MCIHVHGGEKLVQDIHPIDVDSWPSNKQCAIYYKTLQHSARTHGDGIADLREGPNLDSEGCWKEPSLILIRTPVTHKDSQSDDMVELSRFFPPEDALYIQLLHVAPIRRDGSPMKYVVPEYIIIYNIYI